MSKPTCAGCYNDHYNISVPGGCWSRSTAKVVTRVRVPVDMPPPYNKLPRERVFDCRTEQRMCMVDPKALTKQGYWR